MNLYNFLGSYNKAYKTKKIDEKDFINFLSKLKNFYSQTSNIEKTNEELLKDKFKECILNEYQTYANENRVDLAIKKDKKTQVICEFKKPSNINEMLQIGDNNINKKALHEAIWYFYNQENLEISYQIKNILITDTESFFFFNPNGFCNPDLKKICIPYRNRQLAYEDTKTLYAQIGTKIKTKNLKFDYTEFNLKQYKSKILNDQLNDNDIKQLKYFYKALHPDFLLREFNPKDSNELNSRFYNELLYILGLKEEGKNTKKIKPSEQTGTFRDVIYNELTISDKDKFEASIQLIITWLNRILFLKLFESQLVSFNENKAFSFLSSEKISNFNALNQLFFNVLGKHQRTEQFEKYSYVPYLNSSLFELSKYEKEYNLQISGLNIEATLPLFRGSTLSKRRNYPKQPNLLKYLLDFLDSFDFSSNISKENENEDIINSSVLGLIFEKLNGYKDGSYFTPGYITEYMAEQAVNNCVLQKFNEEFKEKVPCKTIDDLANLLSNDSHIKERRDFYNEIIDNIKICDPAVGSGHFLVSVLNYIIALKRKLNILEIKNPIEIQNDSLVIYEINEENQFKYTRNDANTLKIQQVIFEEKRKIIENCLFGVDINPNSVQICCLRLWIELLKNTYYIPNTNEMRILPNIDINIKEGNSLVSKFKVKVDSSANKKLDGRTAQAKDINEYRKLVAEYKDIDSKISKDELKDKIKKIKDKIFPIKQLKLFEDNADKGIFKNSLEWMIEFPELLDEKGNFTGFDIVIGNPPYGVDLNTEEKKHYKDEYKSAKSIPKVQKGSTDTYVLFIERGLDLLKKHSNLLYIIPMSITSSDSCVPIQNLMEQSCKTIKISSFSNRPTQIFDNAGLRVSIVELYNIQNNSKKSMCEKLLTTKLQRKRTIDNPQEMINQLEFVDSIKYKLRGRYAKIGKDIDCKILEKFFSLKNSIADFSQDEGNAIYYRKTGGRYFNVITNYSTGSPEENPLYFNKKLSDAIGLILSSSFFWYFQQIFTDGLHIKDYEIKSFPIPEIPNDKIKEIEDIYNDYLADIEKNVIMHNANNSFKEYKIVKSFKYIEKMDDIVCNLYGLSEEEANYIKNYELEYRLKDTE